MILEFDHVSGTNKKFALEDISFALPAGYIMGLAGKNGAGKSTLLDYIVNPRKQYNGTIKINGTDIRENETLIKNEIGFVSDNNRFFGERSAIQNAQLLGRFYENWDMALFKEYLKRMELPANRSLVKLSRGEYFRFQMAFAIAHKPSLYLLDEVTAGMDPVFRIEFFRVLGEIIEEEKASVLMTSHIEEEMHRKMDYIGVLEQGRLISFGESI